MKVKRLPVPRPGIQSFFLVVLAVVLATVCGCKKEEPPAPPPPAEVVAVTVTPQTVPVTVPFVAQAESSHQVEIVARVNGFLEKILTVEPRNVTARLALGASLFNVGQPDEAETQWRQVIELEPENVEARYDLGFLYLSRTPADVEAARAEWERVIAIAPDSDVARTIQQHLASLEGGAAASSAPAPTEAAGGMAPDPADRPAPSASEAPGGGAD